MYSFPATPLTHALILFSMTAPVWFTYLTWKETPKKALLLSTTCLLWGALMFAVVRYGWMQTWTEPVPLALFTLIIPLGIVILFRNQLLGRGLSQHRMVALQIFRIIGAVFLIELGSGYISPVFAHPAGWGDILVGVTALYVTIKYWKASSIPNSMILLVAILGIVDFLSAFFFGITSSAVPFQLFSFDLPNQVDLYPTGMIPYFLVPYAFCYHILSLTQMRHDNKKTS